MERWGAAKKKLLLHYSRYVYGEDKGTREAVCIRELAVRPYRQEKESRQTEFEVYVFNLHFYHFTINKLFLVWRESELYGHRNCALRGVLILGSKFAIARNNSRNCHLNSGHQSHHLPQVDQETIHMWAAAVDERRWRLEKSPRNFNPRMMNDRKIELETFAKSRLNSARRDSQRDQGHSYASLSPSNPKIVLFLPSKD